MKTCLKSKGKTIKVAELELVPKGAAEWGGFGGPRGGCFLRLWFNQALHSQIILNRVCAFPVLSSVGISK